MLIRRPHRTLLDMFRQHLLAAFRQWIIDSQPAPEAIEAEIAATIAALRGIADTA